jgi:hypothetical protein
LLGRKEQWLVNVYVVHDPTNEENNGMVKILRYGKQLDKVIRDATEGIDKDEFGARVFDLSEDGCNLRIVVEKNDGGYPTYVSSKFLRESEIDGMTGEKIEEVYGDLFKLNEVFEAKSSEEVKELLNTHFFCEVTTDENAQTLSETVGTELNSSGDTEPEEPVEANTEPSDGSEESDDASNDETLEDDEVRDKLDDLMKDL